MPQNKNNKKRQSRQQKGGAPSGYSHLWYSSTPTNVQTLSKYTADHLDGTPMFNPLKKNTEVATPTSGLTPTGVHLGNYPAPEGFYQVSRPIYLTGGGKREKVNNNWVNYAKQFAQTNGISYKDALQSRECRDGYQRSK